MLPTEVRLFSMQVGLDGNVELNVYSCKNNYNSICFIVDEWKIQVNTVPFSNVNPFISIEVFESILESYLIEYSMRSLKWRHYEGDGVSNLRRLDYLLNWLLTRG